MGGGPPGGPSYGYKAAAVEGTETGDSNITSCLLIAARLPAAVLLLLFSGTANKETDKRKRKICLLTDLHMHAQIVGCTYT